MDGSPGGPALPAGLIGAVSGGDITLNTHDGEIVIDRLPSSIRLAGKSVGVHASNSRYLIFTVMHKVADYASLPNTVVNYVHNRLTNSWSTVELPGNGDSQRLTEDWLAATQVTLAPHNRTNPGRNGERSDRTRELPNVKQEYSLGLGANNLIPGRLILRNLQDARQFAINTGKEDSEVLAVKADTVFYRIDDSIFAAKITSEGIDRPALVVKDEDVPEIHWAFWPASQIQTRSR